MNEKKLAVLNAGLELAETVGYKNVKLEQLSELSGVAQSTIYSMFGVMDQVKYEILQHAIDVERAAVFAQMIVHGHPLASCLNAKQKRLAKNHIAVSFK